MIVAQNRAEIQSKGFVKEQKMKDASTFIPDWVSESLDFLSQRHLSFHFQR